MLKKLFGCLMILGLLAAGVVAAGYLLIFKPLQGMSEDWRSVVAELREIETLNDDVRNQAPFEPPKDDLLTDDHVARFVAVSETVDDASSEDLIELREALESSIGADGSRVEPRAIVDALAGFADVYHEAKTAQVTALNAQGFSLEEYAWVRSEVYRAAGMSVLPVDVDAVRSIDFTELNLNSLDDLRSLPERLKPEEAITTPEEPAPASNAERVAPYREDLRDWAHLAALNL